MTRPSNPANYECKGKMAPGMSRGYTVHHWHYRSDGRAECLNEGCGLVLSPEDTEDLWRTPRT